MKYKLDLYIEMSKIIEKILSAQNNMCKTNVPKLYYIGTS